MFDIFATVVPWMTEPGMVWTPSVNTEESIGTFSLSLNRALPCSSYLATISVLNGSFLGPLIKELLPVSPSDCISNLPGGGLLLATLRSGVGFSDNSPWSSESNHFLGSMMSLPFFGGYMTSLSVSEEISEESSSTSATTF